MTSQFKPVERAIDEYLGRRCESAGDRYGEIVRAMMCNLFGGGDRTEDINNIRLRQRVGYVHDSRLRSPDTVLRMLSQLTATDTIYTIDSGNKYRINTAETLNGRELYGRTVLVCLLAGGYSCLWQGSIAQGLPLDWTSGSPW